ncbi:hypothetical protein [Burkholderia sp. WSM2230]|uniref:hypothetical protein n=1 Tax=Burkholderia sp. WSM2230 TaxID=944435 RepID=UPI00040EF24B|nr:hypothetical protein [Burkholderia sp. WSM2230]
MKSRVIDSLLAIHMRLPRIRSVRSVGHGRLALSGAAGALLLSGCYYPYGYYPAYYPSAYPAYYATVPASATQREVPLGTIDDSSGGQQSAPQSSQSAPVQQGQQAQPGPDTSPPAYVVAQPPVYVAPAYPAYYPPPVYPAWYGYGYPGWYGPAVSIGFGWSWGGGGRGRHH